MPADTILDALKLQTQPLHAQLEAHVDVLSRLQSPEKYQQLLVAFYGFYAPVETRLLECQELRSAGMDMELRCKVPLLVRDLRCLNVPIDVLPLATDLPEIPSAAAGFGCLYVLEGATLGSQIIKRLLAQQLAISSDNGGAFFNAYGDRVGEMWQAFRATLAQFSRTYPHTDDAIVASAQLTFLKLDAWFVRRLDSSDAV